MKKNLLNALSLRYESGRGFQSEPFRIGQGTIHGEISLTGTSTYRFAPPAYEIGAARIEILDMLLTRWATAIAIRVSHNDPEYRIKMSWVKKQDRAASPFTLIDEDNSQYYFPIATDLSGEVLPGVPRVGIIIFEPFREMTGNIRARIANARFTVEKFTPELEFRLHAPELCNEIAVNLTKPPLHHQVRERLLDEGANARNLIAGAGRRTASGSSVGAFFWVTLIIIVAAVVMAIIGTGANW